MNENIRFINVIDELKAQGIITDYVQVAASLETNKAGISDIKAGRKKLSLDMLRRMKLSYPTINIEWVIMGEGEMFHTHTPTSNTSGFEEKLLGIIQEKDTIIREQAEIIGSLKEQLSQMKQRLEKNASNAPTSDIASAG